MEYTLSLNTVGQLNGWQDTKYTLGDHFTVAECQFFVDGDFKMGFSQVYDKRDCKTYNFETQSWGTMEITRNAAELFAINDKKMVAVEQPAGFYCSNILPATEEAFV